MTRGLITIATGNLQYYKIAANLLKSYRFFSKSPLPFAIIAEEENEYTALFDDVIIVTDATRSFMDKFLLLKYCPYDETLFFDADSFAFGDLNMYWSYFENATDFSSIGVNVPRDSLTGAWYNVEDIGKYGIDLPYKTRVHTGVCFIRKSKSLEKLYADCSELSRNYSELHFHSYPNSKDECILGVAMPMNKMKAVRVLPEMLAAFPCLTYKKIDILNDTLSYKTPWGGYTEKGIFLHWGTAQTQTPLYVYNAKCLNYRIKYIDKERSFFKELWYKHRICYLMLLPQYAILRAGNFISKAISKFDKMLYHLLPRMR